MQRIQESKIKMCRSVSGILTVYNGLVGITPGLTAAHIDLDHWIAETERHNRGQLNSGAELTVRKNEVRILLEDAIIQIGSSFVAYLTTVEDPVIKLFKDKYQVKDNEIRKKREMQLFAYAYMLFDDLTPFITFLEPFTTADEIRELKDKADNFNALIPVKRTQVNKTALSTQNLEEAIDKINLLLNDTLDILVKPWKEKEPDFYNSYKNARIIVDAGFRKRPEDAQPTGTI